jgi:DNA replication protein DnaC
MEWLKGSRGMLVILGPPGVGKTYACAALYNFMEEMFPHVSKRYWKEADLFARIRKDMTVLEGDYAENMTFLTDDMFVLLDDLESTGITDWRKEALFTFIDARYNSKKPTVISSNLTPGLINEKLGERFHSRIMAAENVIIEIRGQDLRKEGL